MRTLRLYVRVILLATTTLWMGGCWRADSDKSWQLETWDPVSRQTHTITAADVDHKWLVINYWAEWCKPCREEIPKLNHFATAHRDTVLVAGFNFDNIAGDALQTSASHVGITYPVLSSNPAKIFTLPDVDGLPTTLILDAHGHLKTQLQGPQTFHSLEAAISTL